MSDRELRTAGILVAAATLAAGAVVTLGPGVPIPRAGAEPSTPPTSTASPATTTASPAKPGFPSDDHGYLGSAARCDDGQTLMVFGRTSRSLVAVCVGPDGRLEYRGVRLSDQAGLTMAATRSSDGAVVATNDAVTYSITPQVLLVSEGDTVLYRDPWVEYHTPRFSTGSTSTSTTATSASPTATATSTTTTTGASATTSSPTVSTTTVTLAPTG